MTLPKIESGSAATSTIAADRAPRPSALARRGLILAIAGAGAAWLLGPAGHMLVVLPLLLFGPGFLLERALTPSLRLPIFARPTLWLGLSLSAIALLYEWATLFGASLTPPVLAVLAIICGLAVIRQVWVDDGRWTMDDGRQTANSKRRATNSEDLDELPYRLLSMVYPLWWLALLAILALTGWTRIAEVRDLALPNWVDSVHHALMIRVAAERGQAPLSLRPYLPVDQLPYHWGYHVFVAAAMQLSSMELPQAMLVSGQALNVLHGLAAAGLAAYLWRRPAAGIAAALVVGLLSIFPAYYVSWGRYTQLTGLLLLPPLMIAWLELLRVSPRLSWTRTNADERGNDIVLRVRPRSSASDFRKSQPISIAITLALLLAGLSLIHFIVLVFGLCFMGVTGMSWALRSQSKNVDPYIGLALAPQLPLPNWERGSRASGGGVGATIDHAALRSRERRIGRQLAWAAGSAALALALAGPWLWLLATRALLRSDAGQAQALTGQGAFYTLDPRLLWAGNNRVLIALALLAALWGIRRREHLIAALLAWVAALCVLANPWLALYVLPACGLALLAWGAARRRVILALGACALLLCNPLIVGKLPYLAIISNETVVISLFLPIGVLLGGGAAWLWDAYKNQELRIKNQLPGIGSRFLVLGSRLGGAAVLAGLALWGARDLRDVVNPATVLATPADVAAIAWVAAHTPPDARFLINAAPWLETGRGADGGWWLLPLAGRWTSTPPALYDYGPPGYVRETRARTQQVLNFAPGREQALYQLIDRDQIGYIYLGSNPRPLTAAAFPASQGFEQVYAQGGVTIFAVHRGR